MAESESDFGQTIFVITFMVIIALTMVFAAFIYTEVKGPLQNSSFSTALSNSTYDKFNDAWSIFDHAIWFIMVAMIAGVLVSSFIIPTHPVYVIGNMLVMGVEIFLSFVLTNSYFAITGSDPTLQLIAQTSYPITTNLISHLPLIAIVLSTLNCIIMFSHGNATQAFNYG